VVLIFRRRRNFVLLAVVALVPILIAVAVEAGRGGSSRAGSIYGGITGNGLFAALAAFVVAGPVFLPLVIAIVAGDSVAGEASSGTLRYLLAVPVGRTRLLAVKFAAVAVWCLACVATVAIVGVLIGLCLFPAGRLTLLSGNEVSYGAGLARLFEAGGYLALVLLAVAAFGLFVSTLTEMPLAAMAATLTLVIVSEVIDAVPQLSSIHGWLPSHYWQRWTDLLRDPQRAGGMTDGLWVTSGYVAFFLTCAWARFGAKDVTS
jgi:ABC-2 type transport system permease protein